MRKFYAFAVLCAAVLAAVGGTAYLFYEGHVLFGISNLLLAAMAAPYVVKEIKAAFLA